MKFKFGVNKINTEFEGDVEGIYEKHIEYKVKKKTRHQIKEEEKRKTEELKHKQEMQKIKILFAMLLGFGAFCVIALLVFKMVGWL